MTWRLYAKFEKSKAMAVFNAFKSTSPTWGNRYLHCFVKLLAFAFITVALAQPVITYNGLDKKYDEVRVLFVVDVSGSMVYAEDIKPNRLEAVKTELLNLYPDFEHYQVGIIPFAGGTNGYYCPPTHSKDIYTSMTKRLTPDAAAVPGTNITEAIITLQNLIVRQGLDLYGKNIVVVLTDGGKEEADRTNRNLVFKTLQELHSQNCEFFFVGVGGDKQVTLIRRNEYGKIQEYIKNPDGSTAKSLLDQTFLKQAARVSQGEYLHFDKKEELQTALHTAIEKYRGEPSGHMVKKQFPIQNILYAFAAVILFTTYMANRKIKAYK